MSAATVEQLAAAEAAARAEAVACMAKGPPNAWYQRRCNDRASWSGSVAYRTGAPIAVRVCAREGCPHHVHAWSRQDAIYCSGTCRMAVLRARRRIGE